MNKNKVSHWNISLKVQKSSIRKLLWISILFGILYLPFWAYREFINSKAFDGRANAITAIIKSSLIYTPDEAFARPIYPEALHRKKMLIHFTREELDKYVYKTTNEEQDKYCGFVAPKVNYSTVRSYTYEKDGLKKRGFCPDKKHLTLKEIIVGITGGRYIGMEEIYINANAELFYQYPELFRRLVPLLQDPCSYFLSRDEVERLKQKDHKWEKANSANEQKYWEVLNCSKIGAKENQYIININISDKNGVAYFKVIRSK